MNTEKLMYGVIGLLGGVILAGAIAGSAVNNNNQSMMRMMGMRTSSMMTSGNSMTMDEMSGSLTGKSGDNFDEAFLSGMIEHHQGAIDMAKLAKTNAKHDEIKKMADDIIAAQTKEIDLMRTWQKDWGYSAASTGHEMMSH